MLKWNILLIIAALVLSAAPHLAVSAKRARDAQDYQAGQDEVLKDFKERKQKAELRIGSTEPFTGEEAMAFLIDIRDWNLERRGLPDHSQEGLELLKKALDRKLIDPSQLMPNGFPLAEAFMEPLKDIARMSHTNVSREEQAIYDTLTAKACR